MHQNQNWLSSNQWKKNTQFPKQIRSKQTRLFVGRHHNTTQNNKFLGLSENIHDPFTIPSKSPQTPSTARLQTNTRWRWVSSPEEWRSLEADRESKEEILRAAISIPFSLSPHTHTQHLLSSTEATGKVCPLQKKDYYHLLVFFLFLLSICVVRFCLLSHMSSFSTHQQHLDPCVMTPTSSCEF